MRFFVHVQVSELTSRDRERLDLLMGASGYTRTVEENDIVWEMIPGMYCKNIEGEDTYSIRDKVQLITDKVTAGCSMVVTSGEAAWNLPVLLEPDPQIDA